MKNHLSHTKSKEQRLQWQVGNADPSHSWLIPVLAATWFIGLIVMYVMYQKTDISFTQTLKLFALFAVGFTLIPYKWILKVVQIEYSLVLGINIIGIGPLFTSLFLVLNFIFASSMVSNTYEISGCERSINPLENRYVVVVLTDDSYKNQSKLRRFDYVYKLDISDSDSITLTIGKGLFGYDVRVDYEFHQRF